MSPDHTRWLSMALKRQRTDLQFLGSDGRKVDGHQSLVSLASPMLAQVLMMRMNKISRFRNKQRLINVVSNTGPLCCAHAGAGRA